MFLALLPPGKVMLIVVSPSSPVGLEQAIKANAKHTKNQFKLFMLNLLKIFSSIFLLIDLLILLLSANTLKLNTLVEQSCGGK
jgi:hypothetical protein